MHDAWINYINCVQQAAILVWPTLPAYSGVVQGRHVQIAVHGGALPQLAI